MDGDDSLVSLSAVTLTDPILHLPGLLSVIAPPAADSPARTHIRRVPIPWQTRTGAPAPVAQRIEQLVSTQSVGGSNPSGRAFRSRPLREVQPFPGRAPAALTRKPNRFKVRMVALVASRRKALLFRTLFGDVVSRPVIVEPLRLTFFTRGA